MVPKLNECYEDLPTVMPALPALHHYLLSRKSHRVR